MQPLPINTQQKTRKNELPHSAHHKEDAVVVFPSKKSLHNGIHSSNTMDSLERGNLSYM